MRSVSKCITVRATQCLDSTHYCLMYDMTIVKVEFSLMPTKKPTRRAIAPLLQRKTLGYPREANAIRNKLAEGKKTHKMAETAFMAFVAIHDCVEDIRVLLVGW